MGGAQGLWVTGGKWGSHKEFSERSELTLESVSKEDNGSFPGTCLASGATMNCLLSLPELDWNWVIAHCHVPGSTFHSKTYSSLFLQMGPEGICVRRLTNWDIFLCYKTLYGSDLSVSCDSDFTNSLGILVWSLLEVPETKIRLQVIPLGMVLFIFSNSDYCTALRFTWTMQ